MKRTVTRWVSKRFDINSIGKLNADPFNERPIQITVSEADGTPERCEDCGWPSISPNHPPCMAHDGEPEPEKCPCVESDRWKPCCPSIRGHCVCCGFHPGKEPCLSDFKCLSDSKPCREPGCPVHPKPATTDRVVKGVVLNGFFTPFHPNTLNANNNQDATLIIHEKVKEPTLYEAVEAWLVPGLDVCDYSERMERMKAAFNREKVAREKEGK